MKYSNPILTGFYPDPSICRVGDKYYMVNSTFAYFPGIPVFESTDLIHWEQIGNVIDRPSQLDLNGIETSMGVFAPTIRYFNKTFYVINTNVPKQGNFYMTATDPRGPWSDPIFIEGAMGIDPSLFFDQDGTCYYTGTRGDSKNERFYGDNEIWLQELDLTTGKLVGEVSVLYKSALYDAEWSEGPHVYYINGWYYVLIAEGGTGENHAITIARSKNLRGPYEGCKRNPILTHRHFGKDYPVVYVGHSDLIQSVEGDWYLVALASRPCEGVIGLGRETFLAKVTWEDGWPVVNPGIGRLEIEGDSNIEVTKYVHDYSYDFKTKKLPFDMMGLRNPQKEFAEFTSFEHQCLKMMLKKEQLSELVNPAYLAIRQKSYHYQVVMDIELESETPNEIFGLAIVQNHQNYLSIELSKDNSKQKQLTIYQHEKGNVLELKRVNITSEEPVVTLKLTQHQQTLAVEYSLHGTDVTVMSDIDTKFLSTNRAGGFVGNTIGMYGTSHGKETKAYALISQFTYQDL